MADVHGEGQDKSAVLLRVLAIGYRQSEKFPLIKNMEIKVPVFYPRQAGDIEEIRRLIR